MPSTHSSSSSSSSTLCTMRVSEFIVSVQTCFARLPTPWNDLIGFMLNSLLLETYVFFFDLGMGIFFLPSFNSTDKQVDNLPWLIVGIILTLLWAMLCIYTLRRVGLGVNWFGVNNRNAILRASSSTKCISCHASNCSEILYGLFVLWMNFYLMVANVATFSLLYDSYGGIFGRYFIDKKLASGWDAPGQEPSTMTLVLRGFLLSMASLVTIYGWVWMLWLQTGCLGVVRAPQLRLGGGQRMITDYFRPQGARTTTAAATAQEEQYEVEPLASSSPSLSTEMQAVENMEDTPSTLNARNRNPSTEIV